MITFTTDSIDLAFHILIKVTNFKNEVILFDDSKKLRRVTDFEAVTSLFEVNGSLEQHTIKYLITLSDGIKVTVKKDGEFVFIDEIDIQTKQKDYGIDNSCSKHMF